MNYTRNKLPTHTRELYKKLDNNNKSVYTNYSKILSMVIKKAKRIEL